MFTPVGTRVFTGIPVGPSWEVLPVGALAMMTDVPSVGVVVF